MSKQKKIKDEEGGAYWRKIQEAKKSGLNEEDFSRIEELEGSIADLESKIRSCKVEIKEIKKKAIARKKEIELED